MTTLKKRLAKLLKEGHDSSKEMIACNTTTFEDMGMSNTAPGEFAQEEITDHSNLENTGRMANDTDFGDKCDSKCCDPICKVMDTMDDLASDIVDISVKDDEDFEDEDETDIEDVEGLIHKVHESVNTSILSLVRKTLKEDRFGEDKFVVYLWPFAGYQMIPFEVEANHEEEALAKAVAKAEEEGNYSVFADDVEEAENHPDLYMYVDATMEGASQPHYVDAQNLRIEKKSQFGECVKKKLRESNGDYAGPRDFVPDTRIHTSAVLETLKDKIGEGSEGIHVDQDLDKDGYQIWVVTQIDKNKLPETLEVMGVELKKEDGNKYVKQKLDKDFPLMK